MKAWGICAGVLFLVIGSDAFGQGSGSANNDPTAAQSPGSGELDEIIVTARRKSENLENVPVAVSVITAEDIRVRSITTESDLQSAVPGLLIRETADQNQFNYAIRGQSVDAFSGSAPGVLPYVNEVQVSAAQSSSFFDLGGIQVLKGPQGTLFGRNTTGGAVLFETASPTNDFGGYLGGRVGNEETGKVQGALNLPIVPDKVLLRIAADFNNTQGYIRNLFSDEWLGAENSKTGRISLRILPADGWANDTVAQYGEFAGNEASALLYSVNQCGSKNNGYVLYSATSCLYSPSNPAFPLFLAAHPGAYPGGLDALEGYQRELGPWQTYLNSADDHHGFAGYATNKTTYEISPDLQVKNIVGWTNSLSSSTLDIDGTSYPIFQNGIGPGQDTSNYFTQQASEELQLQGKAFQGRLDYIVGGYYATEIDGEHLFLTAFDFTPIFPATALQYFFQTLDRTKAVYAQTTYHFGGGVELTTGYRATWENVGLDQIGGLNGGTPPQNSSTEKPSWNVTLSYQASSELLLYGATRGSWRTGGYNGAAPPVNATASGGGDHFLPETTKDVEIGAKFDRNTGELPVRVNLAFFNQWVDDIQRTAYLILNGNPISVTVNVPEAIVSGAELDGELRPAPWLQVGGSAAYTDARFTKADVTVFGSMIGFGPYADAPRWTGGLFAKLITHLPGDAGVMSFRTDIYAQTNQYFSNLNNSIAPGTQLPGYGLVNLRLDWTRAYGTQLTPSLYVRNLTNKEYYVGGIPEGGAIGIDQADSGKPRQYGLEVRYDF
jgi:iron complex outermembrane receptor protein